MMKSIKLQAESLENVSWPMKCLSCGNDLVGQEYSEQEVKVKPNVITALRSSAAELRATPDKWVLPICKICKRENDKRVKVTKFAFIAFIGFSIFAMLLSLVGKNTQNDTIFLIAGLLFSIGGGVMLPIAMFASFMSKRKMHMNEIMQKDKQKWVFNFCNRGFAKAFRESNTELPQYQPNSAVGTSDSKIVEQSSDDKKGSRGKQIIWTIWAVLGVGYLFTNALPMAEKTNNPGIAIGIAAFIAVSIYKAVKANPHPNVPQKRSCEKCGAKVTVNYGDAYHTICKKCA